MAKKSRRANEAAAAPVPQAEVAPPTRLARAAWLAAALAVLACAGWLAAFPTVSDDIFMHLAVGRHWFETGSFPNPDPWLFALPDYDRGWIDRAYWGTHLGAAWLHSLGGFELLSVLKTLLVVAGAAAPLWLAVRLDARGALVPAVVLAGLWAACNRFIERGSLLSDCIGPWVLALTIAELAKPSRLRWLLPVLILVWTNLHPGVLLGLGFVGLAGLLRAREWRRWGPLVGACVLAALAHPDGVRHLVWALETAAGGAGEAFRRHNFEMMPTFSAAHGDTREVRLFVALASLAGLAGVWSLLRGGRPWFALLAGAVLVYIGCSTVRYVSTAALALPVVFVGLVATSPTRPTKLASATCAATALVAVGLCIAIAKGGYTSASGHRDPGFGLDQRVHPSAPAAFLKSIPYRGQIFNEHSYGAYLAWLWDGDPRIYFHGYVLDERFYEREYLAVSQSPAEFERIVREHDLGVFFLIRAQASPTQGALVHRLLLTKPDWRLVWLDERSMVFLQDRPGNEALLAEHEFRYLDPFRPDRVQRGAREDRARLEQECLRQLRRVPDDEFARQVVRQVLRKDPTQLLRGGG